MGQRGRTEFMLPNMRRAVEPKTGCGRGEVCIVLNIESLTTLSPQKQAEVMQGWWLEGLNENMNEMRWPVRKQEGAPAQNATESLEVRSKAT